MNTKILQELGLTRTEIKIYITLLETGPTSVGKILEKSQLPNSTIHRDLNSLIEKGIISFILEGKKKIYQATKPETFLQVLEDKEKRFLEILPQLKEKENISEQKESASIFKGENGIKEVYSIMINTKGKEYLTFGGGPITEEIMGFTWWLNLHKKRIEQKLKSRQIFDESVKKGGKEIAKNPLTRIKYLSKEFAQFQETIIVENKVAIAVFSKNPYAFLIEDKNVANSYKKYFELLWKMAK